MKGKEIDYLFEDPEIKTQKFALVSIVGPGLPQKCNVWGLKVRGTAETLEQAKALSQKIMRVDENFDIYTLIPFHEELMLNRLLRQITGDPLFYCDVLDCDYITMRF